MNDTPSTDDRALLASYVETWRRAADDFCALARSLPEETWQLPTDLAGWSVQDNVAHTAHLEAILAGAPEETIEVPELPHVTSLMAVYTEQGVLARRGRSMTELVDELEQAVATRHAELQSDPPTDASAAPPRVFGGVGWDNATLLGNRPLDIWMHTQDVRRAVDRPGDYDSPAATHTLKRLGAALPVVLAKRVGADPGASVRLDLVGSGLSFGAEVGADRRGIASAAADATAVITLSDEDFVVLAGGRRGVERTSPEYAGDRELADAVLAHLAVTP